MKVLDIERLSFKKGDFVGIYGPSGSGKSTLLYIMSLIEKADQGKVIYKVNYNYKKDPTGFRERYVGFVFQQYKLISELTVEENIIYPNLGIKKERDLKRKTKELLKFFEIYHLKNLFPHELSGGQQQRVSIARALVKDPLILFADEPTANLDVKNGLKIMELFKKINEHFNTTIISVSHEEEHKKFFKKIIRMESINKVLKGVR